MEIELETRKETNKLVKWNVGIPRTQTFVQSKTFEMYGNNWNLKLATECHVLKSPFTGDDLAFEVWCMSLYCSDKKNSIEFPLTIYIRNKGRDVYLRTITISNQSTEIWRSLHKDFTKTYPDIQVVGTLLQFVFDFHVRIPDAETPIKEEKFVQTYDPNYPENHTCMENLSFDLSKLVEGGTDTDVQLKCGDVSIAAHKLILGARSEVFRTMMQSDMMEGREGIVDIIDMEPKLLNIFIRYIYTGNLPDLTADTALPIYEAADKYQVEALKKRSRQILVENLSPENALVILVAADAHSDSDLKDQLISYIIQEKMPSKKVEWPKFCKEFPKLAIEVLNYFYDLPNVSQ